LKELSSTAAEAAVPILLISCYS